MRLTGEILRHFRAFSTLEQNPALKVLSTPAHSQVTQAVGLPLAQQGKKIEPCVSLREESFGGAKIKFPNVTIREKPELLENVCLFCIG